MPRTARPSEMALKLPGKGMHIRALCGGLTSVRTSLLYVRDQLEDLDVQWDRVQDTVARELTVASMFLGGILDGCIIADLPERDPNLPLSPKDREAKSFSRTPFHSLELRDIQDEVNALRSADKNDQDIQASLWTVVNFWKHYLPYQPYPSMFESGRLQSFRDFQLVLSSDGNALSGPVVYDLLIPAFNAACRITTKLLAKHKVGGNYGVSPIPIRAEFMLQPAAVAAELEQRLDAMMAERR